MRVAVVGGTGFLGRHVVTELARSFPGCRLDLCCAARTSPVFPLPGTFVQGDRADPSLIRELMGFRPDIWIDLALFEPEEMESLVAAWDMGGRAVRSVVVAGSIAEYGLSRRHLLPVTEECPLDAEGPYGRGKADAWRAGLEAFQSRRFPLAWAVLPQLWGQGDPHNRDASWIAQVVKGEPILLRGNGRTLLPDGFVETAAAALVHLARAPGACGQRVNVAGPCCITPLSYLRWAAAELGRPLRVLHASPQQMAEAERATGSMFRAPFGDYDFALDLRRLEGLGFSAPCTAEVGVRRTAAWHAGPAHAAAVRKVRDQEQHVGPLVPSAPPQDSERCRAERNLRAALTRSSERLHAL
jgi:nucleoside-diphosphate-sugar epimerase